MSMLSPGIARLLKEKHKGDTIAEKNATVMVKRIIRVTEEEIFQGGILPPPQQLFFYEVSDFPHYWFIDVQISFL